MSTARGGLWKKFLGLLPQTPRLIGVISSINGEGDFTVVITGGGYVRVLGASTYAIGNTVFIRDGQIESIAPNLPTETIEV